MPIGDDPLSQYLSTFTPQPETAPNPAMPSDPLAGYLGSFLPPADKPPFVPGGEVVSETAPLPPHDPAQQRLKWISDHAAQINGPTVEQFTGETQLVRNPDGTVIPTLVNKTLELTPQERLYAAQVWAQKRAKERPITGAEGAGWIASRAGVGGTLVKLWDDLQTKNAAERVKADLASGTHKASQEDYARIGEAVARTQQDPSFLKGSFDIATALPGYAADFLLTGGAANAFGLGAKSLEVPVRRAVSQGLANAAGKAAVGQVPTQLARGFITKATPRVAGALAGEAGRMASLPMAARILDDATQRQTELLAVAPDKSAELNHFVAKPAESATSAVVHAIAHQYAEQVGERSGEALAALGKAIKVRAIAPYAKSGALDEAVASPDMPVLAMLKKRMLYNGVPAEVAEERITELLQLTAGTVEPDSTVIGKLSKGELGEAIKQLGSETLGMSVMPLASAAPKAASKLIGDAQHSIDLEEREPALRETLSRAAPQPQPATPTQWDSPETMELVANGEFADKASAFAVSPQPSRQSLKDAGLERALKQAGLYDQAANQSGRTALQDALRRYYADQGIPLASAVKRFATPFGEGQHPTRTVPDEQGGQSYEWDTPLGPVSIAQTQEGWSVGLPTAERGQFASQPTDTFMQAMDLVRGATGIGTPTLANREWASKAKEYMNSVRKARNSGSKQGPSPVGPQRATPAEPSQINAQVKQAERQVEEATQSQQQPAAEVPKPSKTSGVRVKIETMSGRKISAPPQIRTTSNRAANAGLKAVREWLITEARAEALHRGDDFNLRQFMQERADNLPQASVDAMNQYLFGETNPEWESATGKRIDTGAEIFKQPQVVPSILRPTPQATPTEAQAPPSEEMPDSEAKARELAKSPANLRKRLSEAKQTLTKEAREAFGEGTFDFDGKRLVGDNGLVLQWRVRRDENAPISYENQQTTTGDVVLLGPPPKAKSDADKGEAKSPPAEKRPDQMTPEERKAWMLEKARKRAESSGTGTVSPSTKTTGERKPLPPASTSPESTPSEPERPAADAAAEARRKLAEALKRMSDRVNKGGKATSGIDPELLSDALDVVNLAFDAGIKTFAELREMFAKDVWPKVERYVVDAWSDLREAMGDDESGMDEATMTAAETESPPQDKPESKYGTPEKPNRIELGKKFGMDISIGRRFTIVEARKRASELVGGTIEPGTQAAKDVDEAVEQGIVRNAKKFARENEEDEATFDRMVDLYERQPNLGVRTSESAVNQAFSTPAPLAWLANVIADVGERDYVLDSTAGNGMLLIGAGHPIANELDPKRADAIDAIYGIKSMRGDAMQMSELPPVDAVIINPPFGKKGDRGSRQSWTVDGKEFENIDHAITLATLKNLADDGKAVIIVGSKGWGAGKPLPDAERAAAYANQKRFYDALYGKYNVVDAFTVHGDLYSKMGASFPVDVFVVNGVGKSERPLPYNFLKGGLPNVYDSWDGLKADKLKRLANREQTAPDREVSGLPDSDLRRRDEADVHGDDRSGDTSPQLGGREGRSDGDAGGLVSDDRTRPTVRGQEQNETGVSGRPAADVSDQQGGDRAGAVPSEAEARVDSGPRGTDVDSSRSGPVVSRDKDAGRRITQDEETEFQTTYEPLSGRPGGGTLVPRSHRRAVGVALKRVEDKYGNLDEFVRNELGFTEQEFYDNEPFLAEQVDTLALSFARHKDGLAFINADQTGVGKGRTAAAMIVYAMKNGLFPVFITQKPKLFADMYRDLAGIGRHSPDKPFRATYTGSMTGPDVVPLYDDQNGNPVIMSQTLSAAKAALDRIAKALKSPGVSQVGTDAIFTTYNQLNQSSGEDTYRNKFLSDIAPYALFIMDESHEAGGSSKPQRMVKNEAGVEKVPRAKFARDLAARSAGVMFLSGTYAKNAAVMSLYARTGLGGAVKDIENLSKVMASGGVPMQQVVSEMLVEGGMMMRRERTFAGIDFATDVLDVNRETADEITKRYRDLVDFNAVVREYMNETDEGESLANQILSGGGRVGSAPQTGREGGLSVTNFGSLLWSIVDQMMLMMKADAVADKAIAAHRAGESPLIGLDNTLGSALEDYVTRHGIKPGQRVDFSFLDLLQAYLRKSRTITVTPDRERPTEKEYIYLTDEMLSRNEVGRRAVAMASSLVDQFDAIDMGVPASPIDWMRMKIAKAGLKVGEITGRELMIDYSDPANPILATRKPGGKSDIDTIKYFNANDDMIVILNRSGATGVSAHASRTFNNQRRRHMVIAQSAKNIDEFMQLLGRINRTGQVASIPGKKPNFMVRKGPLKQKGDGTRKPRMSSAGQAAGVVSRGKHKQSGEELVVIKKRPIEQTVLPRYTMALSSMPAEWRPASQHVRKLASLNANVTASAKGSVNFDSVPNILNKIGDEIVAQYLADNDSLNQQLGSLVSVSTEGDIDFDDGVAAKATSRLSIQPWAVQERFWNDVIAMFNGEIEYLNSINANPLAAQSLDLRAKTISSAVIHDGDANSTNPFDRPARLLEVNARVLGSPMSIDTAMEKIADTLGLPKGSSATLDDVRTVVRDNMSDARASLENEYNRRMDAAGDDATKAEAVRAWHRRVEEGIDIFADVYPGRVLEYVLSLPAGQLTQFRGVVVGLKKRNASAPAHLLSSWVAEIAVNTPEQRIKTTLSKILAERKKAQASQSPEETGSRWHWESRRTDEDIRSTATEALKGGQDTHETRVIGVGNLVAAYEQLMKGDGKVTFYTDQNGDQHRGIVMPRSFKIKDFADNQEAVFVTPEQVAEFLESRGAQVAGREGGKSAILITNVDGVITITVPSRSAKAAKRFNDKPGIALVTVGTRWEQKIPRGASPLTALKSIMSVIKLSVASGTAYHKQAMDIINRGKPPRTQQPDSGQSNSGGLRVSQQSNAASKAPSAIRTFAPWATTPGESPEGKELLKRQDKDLRKGGKTIGMQWVRRMITDALGVETKYGKSQTTGKHPANYRKRGAVIWSRKPSSPPMDWHEIGHHISMLLSDSVGERHDTASGRSKAVKRLFSQDALDFMEQLSDANVAPGSHSYASAKTIEEGFAELIRRYAIDWESIPPDISDEMDAVFGEYIPRAWKAVRDAHRFHKKHYERGVWETTEIRQNEKLPPRLPGVGDIVQVGRDMIANVVGGTAKTQQILNDGYRAIAKRDGEESALDALSRWTMQPIASFRDWLDRHAAARKWRRSVSKGEAARQDNIKLWWVGGKLKVGQEVNHALNGSKFDQLDGLRVAKQHRAPELAYIENEDGDVTLDEQAELEELGVDLTPYDEWQDAAVGDYVYLAHESPMKSIFEPLKKLGMEGDFSTYAEQRARLWRWKAMRSHYPGMNDDLPPDALQESVERFERERPELVRYFDQLADYLKQAAVLKFIEGRITARDLIRMISAHTETLSDKTKRYHYVPLPADLTDDTAGRRTGGRSGTDFGGGPNRQHGTDRPTNPMRENIDQHVREYVTNYYDQAFLRAVDGLLAGLDDPAIGMDVTGRKMLQRALLPLNMDRRQIAKVTAEMIEAEIENQAHTPGKPSSDLLGIIAQQINDQFGIQIQPEDINLSDFRGIPIFQAKKPNMPNVFTWHDPRQPGERKYALVTDPLLVKMLRYGGPPTQTKGMKGLRGVVRVAAAANRPLRTVIVRTGSFLYRTMQLDAAYQMMSAEERRQALIPFANAIKGTSAWAVGSDTQAMHEMELLQRSFQDDPRGPSHGAMDRFKEHWTQHYKKALEWGLQPIPVKERDPIAGLEAGIEMLSAMLNTPGLAATSLNAALGASEIAESMPRLGAYLSVKEQGGSDLESVAAFMESSGLFAQKPLSETLRTIGPGTMFMNPMTQVFYGIWKDALDPDPLVKAAWGAKVAMFAGAGVAFWFLKEALMAGDDEESRRKKRRAMSERPDDLKQTTLYLPIPGTNKILQIPVGGGPGGVAMGHMFNMMERIYGGDVNYHPSLGKMAMKLASESPAGSLEQALPVAAKVAIEQGFNYDLFRNRAIVPEHMQELPLDLQFQPGSDPLMYIRLGQKLGLSPKRLRHFFESLGHREFTNTGKMLGGVYGDTGEDWNIPGLGPIAYPKYSGWRAQSVQELEKLNHEAEVLNKEINKRRASGQKVVDLERELLIKGGAIEARKQLDVPWSAAKKEREKSSPDRERIKSLEDDMVDIARRFMADPTPFQNAYRAGAWKNSQRQSGMNAKTDDSKRQKERAKDRMEAFRSP